MPCPWGAGKLRTPHHPQGSVWELEFVAIYLKSNFHFIYIKILEIINVWWSHRSVLPPIATQIWNYFHIGKFEGNIEVIRHIVICVGCKRSLISRHLHRGWNKFKSISDLSLLPISFPSYNLCFSSIYLRSERGWSLFRVGGVLWILSDCRAAEQQLFCHYFSVSKPAKWAWKWKDTKSSILC